MSLGIEEVIPIRNLTNLMNLGKVFYWKGSHAPVETHTLIEKINMVTVA